MKVRTRQQVESAKRRAELAAANLRDDEDRADEFADMSVEEYAELKGITIQNPKGEKQMRTNMTAKVIELTEELEEANDRIEELEAREKAVLDALGLEIADEDEDDEEDDEEETDEEEE